MQLYWRFGWDRWVRRGSHRFGFSFPDAELNWYRRRWKWLSAFVFIFWGRTIFSCCGCSSIFPLPPGFAGCISSERQFIISRFFLLLSIGSIYAGTRLSAGEHYPITIILHLEFSGFGQELWIYLFYGFGFGRQSIYTLGAYLVVWVVVGLAVGGDVGWLRKLRLNQ